MQVSHSKRLQVNHYDMMQVKHYSTVYNYAANKLLLYTASKPSRSKTICCYSPVYNICCPWSVMQCIAFVFFCLDSVSAAVFWPAVSPAERMWTFKFIFFYKYLVYALVITSPYCSTVQYSGANRDKNNLRSKATNIFNSA